MKYKPHEHIPLLLFGLAATPLSAINLINIGNPAGVEIAAALVIFGACATVLGITAYWKHTL